MMLELFANIKKYRKLRGMTQDELAKKTGYTDRSSIAKIENGDVDLPQSKIFLLADALGVAPGDLMGNTGVVSTAMSQEEQQLLDDYRTLNADGRKKAREYITDLTEQKKYTQDTELSALTAV